MLDMGFEPQIQETAQWLPSERQTALFTATWPMEVRDLAQSLTKDAVHIQVGTKDAHTANADIRQHIVTVNSDADKIKFLEDTFFKKLQETDASGLIFVKTKKTAAWLFQSLGDNGAPIVCLHGDMDQNQRDWSLKNFKEGKARVLVATDVAQRGLDIRNVQIVVNYDPPANIQDYVHRIGRTGRAGEKGDSYTCLSASDWSLASQIIKQLKKSGQEIPQELSDIAEGKLDGSWGGKYSDAAWDNKYAESTSYESYESPDPRDRGGLEDAQESQDTSWNAQEPTETSWNAQDTTEATSWNAQETTSWNDQETTSWNAQETTETTTWNAQDTTDWNAQETTEDTSWKDDDCPW